jgi:multicomponent Na+:H+ antiporter subunit B
LNSLILQTAARYLQPLLLLFSIYLLLAGHNEPGGGFSGGLMAAAAMALQALAYDVTSVRRLLVVDSRSLIGLGLLLAAASGMQSFWRDQPYMASYWGSITVAGFGELQLGTPLLFDTGVYLVVIGVALTILFALAEE